MSSPHPHTNVKPLPEQSDVPIRLASLSAHPILPDAPINLMGRNIDR